MEVMRPPSITIAIGLTISRPATLPRITNGNTAAAVATATVNVGANRSCAPRRTSSAPKAWAPVEPESLEAIDQHDAVAGGDAKQREERDQRAERERSAVDERRQHPADEGHRQGEEGQPRQAPAPESGLEEQEDGDQGSDTEAHDPSQADLLGRRGLREHLGVVFEWELAVREAIFDVGGHRVEAAAADVGFDVDVALGGVAPDNGRRGLDAHVGHLFQPYVTAVRRVDQQVADVLHALRARRARPLRRPRTPSARRRCCRPRHPATTWPTPGGRHPA